MANRGMKRKVLTLEERVKVIRLSEDGQSSKKIATEMGVGKTQVNLLIIFDHKYQSYVDRLFCD
jgi:transcriptional regulator